MNEDPVARPGSLEPDLPRKPYATPRLVTHGSIQALTQLATDGDQGGSLIPPT
jgi:hypothetical protein